ncbi:MAG: DUF2730 family protein [Bosea sp.]|jgi:hypothetical protein|nr:DUF2730 family protein [Bosea sp. (in: a-proteobacteria)]
MDIAVLEFVRSYGGALALMGSLATILIATKFVTKEAFAKEAGILDGRIRTLEGKIDTAEDRILKVENAIAHLPDKTGFHRMEIAMTELKGQLAAMDERLKPVARMAERMHEHMLDTTK